MNDITFTTFEDLDKNKFPRILFLNMDYGVHQVRLLSQPKMIFTHYFKDRGSIRCLGSDCIVCKNNKSLQAEFPENYKQQPSYNPSQPRHYVNVLDRTHVKICPKTDCQNENKMDLSNNFPAACRKCGALLVEVPVTLSDKVKVANINVTNAEKLMAFRQAVRDDNGEPIGLGGFDLEFFVTRTSGGKKDISVQVSSKKNAYDTVTVPEDSLYDVDKAVVTLTAPEMHKFVSGVSLKDIFVARRATAEAAEPVDASVSKSVEDRLNTLGVL